VVSTPNVRLGAELSDARAAADRSLRSVAEEADISAAYLQKLERGAVATPSPKILRRLAIVLGLHYDRLMGLAGFAPPSSVARTPLEAKLASAELTEVEERSVAAFVEVLIAMRRASRTTAPLSTER
jgi:transcriptional regulator with XRE-family HTH domain